MKATVRLSTRATARGVPSQSTSGGERADERA